MKILLNTEKIMKELDRVGLKKVQLAREMGITKQLLNHHLVSKSTLHVDLFAKALSLDPRDLVIFDRNKAA